MIWTGVSETRWWARKGSAGHGAAEEEEGARAKERRPAPEEGLLPRTADFRHQADRAEGSSRGYCSMASE